MATFKEAYDWMAKVQRACLDAPVTIHLDINYFAEGCYGATMFVHLDDELFACEWTRFHPETFDQDQKVILALLCGLGVKIEPDKDETL